MSANFKDHFSEGSEAYCKFRPSYPKELFLYLSSITQSNERAWDCATGSGQSAIGLADFFTEVIGTDASKNQIDNAVEKSGVTYRVENAENSSFETNSVDLITIAQAIHWFNIQYFAKEVTRVLKDNGVLAAWSYGVLNINSDLNKIINHLYGVTLDSYWPPERKIIEEGYSNIVLPMQKIETPTFTMETQWNLFQLIGYLCTWSAVKKYELDNAVNPVERYYGELSEAWGDPEQKLVVQWPLSLKVWLNLDSSAEQLN